MESTVTSLFILLRDNDWHTSKELNNLISWNFKDRIFKLRAKGVVLESKSEGKIYSWRLVSYPDHLKIINGRLIDTRPRQLEINVVENGKERVEIVKEQLKSEGFLSTLYHNIFG